MWISLISHYDRSHTRSPRIMTLFYQFYLYMAYPFSSMDVAVIFGSLMSLKAYQSRSHGRFILIIKSHANLWSDNLHVDHKIILWVEENSHVMLFCQQSLLQLRSHSYFLSHTLMGSIYLCYVDFLLVTLVMVLWLTTDGAATKPRAYYGAHMVELLGTRWYRG